MLQVELETKGLYGREKSQHKKLLEAEDMNHIDEAPALSNPVGLQVHTTVYGWVGYVT